MTAAEKALLARLTTEEDHEPWLTDAEYHAAEELAERGLVHLCYHPSGRRLAYPSLRALQVEDMRAAPTPLHPSLLP
jgi:hypothetical protein